MSSKTWKQIHLVLVACLKLKDTTSVCLYEPEVAWGTVLSVLNS